MSPNRDAKMRWVNLQSRQQHPVSWRNLLIYFEKEAGLEPCTALHMLRNQPRYMRGVFREVLEPASLPIDAAK